MATLSADRARAPRRTRWLAGLAVVAVVALAAFWLLRPSPIDGLLVERAGFVAAAGDPTAARRFAVEFSVPEDLAATRAHIGVGYIAARLSACGQEREQREVVTQSAEYLGDHGRVTALGSGGPRFRYRALFDDRLTEQVDHGFRDTPARGEALCFDLKGGSMWWGTATSRTIPLASSMTTPAAADTAAKPAA